MSGRPIKLHALIQGREFISVPFDPEQGFDPTDIASTPVVEDEEVDMGTMGSQAFHFNLKTGDCVVRGRYSELGATWFTFAD